MKRYEPYCLLHTGLTWLGEDSGGDVFALARIAGHSSITTTQRYILQQAETIETLFEKAARRERLRTVVTTRNRYPRTASRKWL